MSGGYFESQTAQLEAMFASLAEAPLFGLSDDERVAGLEAARRLQIRAEQLVTRMVGEVDATGAGRGLGARSTAQLLTGQQIRMTPTEAKQTVKLAQALRDPEFADTEQAFATGEIGARHAARIVDAVGKLPSEASREVRAVVQQHLVDAARTSDPAQVARLGRTALHRIDPDLADRLLAKQLQREERQAARDRTLWFRPTGTGTGAVRFGGHLDAVSAEIVRTALEALSKPTPTEKDGSEAGTERRTHGQRQADALVELARRSLQTGDLPKHGGEPIQVVVTIKYQDLVDGINAAYLPTGEAISATQARMLACDANIIPAVLDSAGVTLDMGRGKRGYAGKLRKALDLRDGGCAFPSCDIPAAWCDAHHIHHWADGGDTSLDNGVLLCRHHHLNVIHRDDWQIRPGPDRRPEFIPPPWVDPEQKPLRNPRHDLPHAA